MTTLPLRVTGVLVFVDANASSLLLCDILRKYVGLTISLIPHTMEITNMAYKAVGDKVNVEADILAKYIAKQKR